VVVSTLPAVHTPRQRGTVNTAYGDISSVSGGGGNTASGEYSSVSGGRPTLPAVHTPRSAEGSSTLLLALGLQPAEVMTEMHPTNTDWRGGGLIQDY